MSRAGLVEAVHYAERHMTAGAKPIEKQHGESTSHYLNDMSFRKRPDWSRRLPRPLVIPKLMTLTTLADVRKLMQHLPKDHRAKSMWRHVAAELDKAAAGADVADVSIALCRALMLEHVEYRPG